VSIEITSIWKQVTPELQSELVAFWMRWNAIADLGDAAARARQAVCVARGEQGEIVGVGTAVLRVLPRLRQPMYYYRQFFAPELRGQRQAMPFYNRVREVLDDYNASLATPESLGVLLELESAQLAAHYTHAHVEAANATFIGYSPRGLQLRVSYFANARLLGPITRHTAEPAAFA
jgi:hypothetical protein